MDHIMRYDVLCPLQLYLSYVRIDKFGHTGYSNEFKLHKRINVFEVGNDIERNILMRAFEVLLWPTQKMNGIQPQLDEPSVLYSRTEETSIEGKFEGREQSNNLSNIQFSYSVLLSWRNGAICARWFVDGREENLPKLRKALASMGLHSASVIFFPGVEIVNNYFLPISFFPDSFNEAPCLRRIRMNMDALKCGDINWADAYDSFNYDVCKAHDFVVKIRKLIDLPQANLALVQRRRELKPLVEHSRHKKRLVVAQQLEERIREHELMIATEEAAAGEIFRKRRESEAAMAKSVSEDLKLDQEEITQETLVRALQQMEEDLRRKENALMEIGKLPETLDDLRVEEESFRRSLREQRHGLLKLQQTLGRLQIERSSAAARLRFIRDHRSAEDLGQLSLRSRMYKADFAKDRSSQLRIRNWDYENSFENKAKRFKQLAEEKTSVEEELADSEKALMRISDSLRMNEFRAKPTKQLMISGSEHDRLEAEAATYFDPNYVYVIEAMTWALKSLNVAPEWHQWAAFGYYASVIDHIEVDKSHRNLLQLAAPLLASFLVRDLEVAYKVSGKLKMLNFADRINFICLDKGYSRVHDPAVPFDEDAGTLLKPARCEPLSSYLKIKTSDRFPLCDERRSQLRRVIDRELLNHYVIAGDPSQQLDFARNLLHQETWRSCTFVFSDGSSVSEKKQTTAPSGPSVLQAYEAMWTWWESKQAQIKPLIDASWKFKKEYQTTREKARSFREDLKKKEYEIEKLRWGISALEGCRRRCTLEINECQREIAQLSDPEQDTRVEGETTLDLELENRLRDLDSQIAQHEEEVEKLSSALIVQQTRSLLLPFAESDKQAEANKVGHEIRALESQIDRIKTLLATFEDACPSREREEDGANSTEDEQDRAVSWYKPDTAFHRANILVLERKIKKIRNEARANEEQGVPATWSADVNYAEQLWNVERVMRRQCIIPYDEEFFNAMRDLCAEVPPVPLDSDIEAEILGEILSVSGLELPPSPAQRAIPILLRRFRTTFSQLSPCVDLFLSNNSEHGVDDEELRDESSVGQRKFVGLPRCLAEQGGSRATPPDSGQRQNAMRLSALVTRAASIPPQLFVVERGQLEDLPVSHQNRFFSEFATSSQILVISIGEYGDLGIADNRLTFLPDGNHGSDIGSP